VPEIKIVMPQEDDWRLDRRDLIEGHTLTWERWRAPKPSWDHDHCVLCWAKIADCVDRAAQSEAAAQTEAYVNEDRSEWLCAECAGEFREMLHLSLDGGPATA
jgi:Pyruvate/2-oxoacid:ferredoxin oxidoreductase delta subunit